MLKATSLAVLVAVVGMSAASAATFTYDVSNAVVDESIKSGSGSHSIVMNKDRYTFQDGAKRLGSDKKPMPWVSLERTHETRIKSFSLPWKASTEATSIDSYSALARAPARRMYSDTYFFCPS